jgi:four helix bundle protein
MSQHHGLPLRGHRQLVAWQKAMDLAVRVLDLCDEIARTRHGGVLAQLRRSIVAIPSNIAEGHDRPRKEYLRSLRIARGELREAETQLELLLRRRVTASDRLLSMLRDADEVGRILYGLARSVSDRPEPDA